jgi:hypothetical protein
MNTKGIKFLAVLAVLAMAFAACVVLTASDKNDAIGADADTEAALKDAVAADNFYVKLTADITLESAVDIAKEGTLDLNGHTLKPKSTGYEADYVVGVKYGGKLTVKDSSADESGKITTEEIATVYGAIKMTLKDEVYANKNASLIVDSGTISGYYYAITGNGTRDHTDITINGGNIVGIKADDSLGIYHPQDGTLKVTGGKFTAYSSAIEMRAGTLIIEDGSFKATATTYKVTPSGSGSTTEAAAIAVSQHTTEKSISVNIKAGTFEAVKAISVANPQDNDSTNSIAVVLDGGVFKGGLVNSDERATTKLTVNGGAFSDLTALRFVQAGKSMDLIGNVTIEANAATTVLASTTLNLALGSSLKISDATGGTAEDKHYTLINNGTINVEKGAALTGWNEVETDYHANVKMAQGASIEYAGEDVKPEASSKTDGTVNNDIDTFIDEAKDSALIVLSGATIAADNTKTVDAGSLDVAFVGTGTNTVTNLNVAVATTSDAGSVSFSGFGAVSGTVTTGTGTAAQTITLKAMTGSFTISKGSIIIDGDYSGEVTIAGGADLKLAGKVTGNFTVKYDTTSTGTAKVIIEEGKSLEIETGKVFTIDSEKIVLQVYGKLFATGTGSIASKGNIIVNDGGEVASAVDDAGKITITANSGSKVSGVITLDHETAGAKDSTFTAYSGSDINFVDKTSTLSQFSGKDAEGGTWTYDAVADTLYLNGYIGTYNFGAFAEAGLIANIIPVGINKVSYTMPETFYDENAFPVLQKIYTKSETGTFVFEVDVSKASKASIESGISFSGATAVDIDTVILDIIIKGTNPLWDAKTIRAAGVAIGDIDNSIVGVDILSNYTADKANVKAIVSPGASEINNSTVIVKSAGTGIYADGQTVTVKSGSGIEISAKAVGFDGKMDVKGISSVTISGGAALEKLDVSQDSKFTASDVVLEGALVNDGIINLSGTTVVKLGASIKNNTEFNVEGTMNVFGKVDNVAGTFTNNGIITVFSKKIDESVEATAATHKTLGVPHDDSQKTATGDLAQVKQIVIKASEFQNDGSLKINKAEVSFVDKEDAAVTPAAGYGIYTGTLTTTQADSKTYYVLNLVCEGVGIEKSTISITYNEAGEATKEYTPAVSGKVKMNDDKPYTLIRPYSTDATKYTDGVKAAIVSIDTLPATANAYIAVASGKIINNSIINYYGTVEKTVVGYGATFEGNLNTGIQTVVIDGKFKGDIDALGAVKVNYKSGEQDGNIEGDIVAIGGVVSTGTIKGDIASETSVTVKNLEGDITILRQTAGDISVTITGDALGELTYLSKYKATKDAETKTVYTATLNYDVDLTKSAGDKELGIKMMEGADATASTAVVPGYFAFGKMGTLATGKNVNLAVTAGKFAFPESVDMPVRYAMVFEAGSTIEVASIATLDVTNAAIKVSKDATSNFVTGTTPVTDYGVVKCIMSFQIQSGAYTIYSDVTYAVANCEEGSVLTVEAATATINDSIIIPKDVEVIVSNGTTVAFGENGLFMSDGAKITIAGTGKVTFTTTGKEATTEIVYTVNGTFAYGDNVMELSGIRFSSDDNVIAGVAATSTEAAKLDVKLTYKDGTAKIAEGYGTGIIKLENGSEVKIKDATPTKVFGTFVVGADAVFDAVKLDDAAGVVNYKKYDAGAEPEIKEYVKDPTVVGVEGTLNLTASTTVLGSYIGFGKVTLAAGKTLTIDKADAPASEGKNLAVPGSLNIYVVDTTDEANGYLFNFATADAGAADLVLKATTYKYGALTMKVMTIQGTLGFGSAKATTEAFLDGLTVDEDAVIYGDEVYVIGNSFANGYVGAGIIYMDDTDPDFADLKYEITFVKDEYTVYTKFDSISWEDVSDINIINGATVDKKLDLSGKDVNITIAEGKALTLNAILIIGTPITVLGDDEGSSISGKVIINAVGVYLVAYADVDLSEAEIVDDGGKDAVFSKLDVENVPYAAIFAQDDNAIKLSKADAALIPEIVGYNFTAWLNYNGDANAKIGETNAYADAKAVLCTVMVKYVAGVDYYMDGVLFSVYDIPTDVPYGSYFTAKISDTTKYQGNPLINGLKTVCVDDDMVLEASGVTPIPEPPAPEPVVGDSGLSLTDILLIVLVILIAIMVVILVLRLNRS